MVVKVGLMCYSGLKSFSANQGELGPGEALARPTETGSGLLLPRTRRR